MTKYLIAIFGIVGMMIAWTLVQSLWRRSFADQISEDDVLAGRNSCGGNCGCSGSCSKRNPQSKTH